MEALLLIFPLLIFLPSSGMAADSQADERSFKAELSGSQEVPPVNTKATGEATFQFNMVADRLTYRVTLKGIANVTAAHVHQGQKGKNGPPVATLFTEPKKPAISGTLYVEGRIRAYELIGPLKEKALQSLVEMIEAGDTYLNVHTTKHPEGEIRGQIK